MLTFEIHEVERLEGRRPVRRTWHWSQGARFVTRASDSGGVTTSRPSGVRGEGRGTFAAPSGGHCGKRTV